MSNRPMDHDAPHLATYDEVAWVPSFAELRSAVEAIQIDIKSTRAGMELIKGAAVAVALEE